MYTVAFQGEPGAYSEEAVLRFFGSAVEPVPQREFRQVGSAVLTGEVDYGLLPVENTLAGSVVGSYDVLAAEDLQVVGEVITPIHHCVLGAPGSSLEALTRVTSHPVALAQCTRFLRSHPRVEGVAGYDTAGAAREVAERRDPSLGAIAGRGAAERYGLQILAADIEDRPDNQTRFLVVSRKGAPPPSRAGSLAGQQEPLRTALLVETRNIPGALVRFLLPFAEQGINLSKIESRPTGEPWTYRFFVELDADAAAEDAQRALTEAREHAAALRILGSYPRWSEPDGPRSGGEG